MTFIYNIKQIEETAAEVLARFPSKIFCFYGEMGAGKTTFISALAKQLGCTEMVSSPTYSLVNQYAIPSGDIYHLDLFRLTNAAALLDIGFEELLCSGHYIFIEWPQLAIPFIQDPYLHLEFNKIAEEQREVKVMTMPAE